MLNLKDTVRCIELALITPAQPGEYRVFNQFTESFSINEMAALVVGALGGNHRDRALTDPRVELEDHYYNAAHTKLVDLGLVPHLLDAELVRSVVVAVQTHKDRVIDSAILPRTRWNPGEPGQRLSTNSSQPATASVGGQGGDERAMDQPRGVAAPG